MKRMQLKRKLQIRKTLRTGNWKKKKRPKEIKIVKTRRKEMQKKTKLKRPLKKYIKKSLKSWRQVPNQARMLNWKRF